MAYLEGYGRYIDIEIDTAVIDADLTHFPLAVPLNSANAADVFTEVGGNFLKIAVTMADGTTHLFVEVEQWDATDEKALLWVSRDTWTIPATGTPFVRLYFDATAADNTTYIGTPGNRTEVWNSDFAAVYTMAQDPSGGADCIIDSSGNENHGTPNGSMTSGDLVDGQIGKALDFDGSNDYIDSVIDSSKTTLRMQCIFAPSVNWTSGSDRRDLLYWRESGGGFGHSSIAFNRDDDGKIEFVIGDILDPGLKTTTTSWDADTVYQIDVQFDGSNAFIFVDGVQENSTGASGSVREAYRFLIASRETGGFNDAKIQRAIFGADISDLSAWIKADYHAQTDNLVTFGATQSTVTLTNIQATINVSGSPVSGATVFVLNATQGTVAAEVVTDVNGTVSVDVSGQHAAGDLYHVCAEHEAAGTYYNGKSMPFINPEV